MGVHDPRRTVRTVVVANGRRSLRARTAGRGAGPEGRADDALSGQGRWVLPFGEEDTIGFVEPTGWIEVNGCLRQEFRFRNFSEAFAFISRVALLAEKQNHHPTITNTWNRVALELTTHDAGNTVTERDRALAASIDALLG